MTEAAYGLDAAALGAIDAAGHAAGDAKAAEKAGAGGGVRKTRANLLDRPFRAELAQGLPISRFVLTSGANAAYQRRFDYLHGCYEVLRADEPGPVCGVALTVPAAKVDLLSGIGGVNTYAKLLRGYQAILLASAGLVTGDAEPAPLPGGAKALEAAKTRKLNPVKGRAARAKPGAAPPAGEPAMTNGGSPGEDAPVVDPVGGEEPASAEPPPEPAPVLTEADKARIMAEHPMGSELMASMCEDGVEADAAQSSLDDPELDDAPGSLMASPAPSTPAPAGEESQEAEPLPHERPLAVAEAQAAFAAAKGTEHEADARRALKSARKREQRAKAKADAG